jgi:hypothetical protein
MSEGIKAVSLTSEHENPQIVVTRYWSGHIVVRTAAPVTPMEIREPREVTIPLFESLGPLSREREAGNLRKAFGSAADVYVVACRTAGGSRKQGMFAIPKASELLIEVR